VPGARRYRAARSRGCLPISFAEPWNGESGRGTRLQNALSRLNEVTGQRLSSPTDEERRALAAMRAGPKAPVDPTLAPDPDPRTAPKGLDDAGGKPWVLRSRSIKSRGREWAADHFSDQGARVPVAWFTVAGRQIVLLR
jgi:hypothetical protein